MGKYRTKIIDSFGIKLAFNKFTQNNLRESIQAYPS